MPLPHIPEAPSPVTIPEGVTLDHARALLLLCELNRKAACKENPLGMVLFRVWAEAFYERYGLNGWDACSDLAYKFALAHGAPRKPDGDTFRPHPTLAHEPGLALAHLNRIEADAKMKITPPPPWLDPNYVEPPKLALHEGAVIDTPAGPARLVRSADGSVRAVLVNPPVTPPVKTTANDDGAGARMDSEQKKGEDRREDANAKGSGAPDAKATRRS